MISFILGLFVGTIAGVMLMCLLISGRDGR